MGLLCAITSSLALGQKISEGNVPESVRSAFKSKFPNVTEVAWEREKTGFEANFTLNKTEVSSTFDVSGKWLETEKEIKVADLPQAVQQKLKTDYVGFKVKEASHIVNATNDESYETEVEKGADHFDVLITRDGKKLSESRIKKTEEKD